MFKLKKKKKSNNSNIDSRHEDVLYAYIFKGFWKINQDSRRYIFTWLSVEELLQTPSDLKQKMGLLED